MGTFRTSDAGTHRSPERFERTLCQHYFIWNKLNPNIINLLEVVFEDDWVLLVIEYAGGGSEGRQPTVAYGQVLRVRFGTAHYRSKNQQPAAVDYGCCRLRQTQLASCWLATRVCRNRRPCHKEHDAVIWQVRIYVFIV